MSSSSDDVDCPHRRVDKKSGGIELPPARATLPQSNIPRPHNLLTSKRRQVLQTPEHRHTQRNQRLLINRDHDCTKV